MTKQEFLNGTSFTIKGELLYQGHCTYKYDGECIVRESRRMDNEEVLFSAYHLNIDKIGTKSFKGGCYVLDKRVKMNVKFEDLIEYKEPNN